VGLVPSGDLVRIPVNPNTRSSVSAHLRKVSEIA
jgi:hypothetical protein